MARGRMLDQRFTQSDKLNSVSRDARLVYASILPYLDREGRTCAEPMAVKVNVFRRSDFTIEEITACLAELATVGLIELYADEDNDAILQYTAFRDFNSPNSREKASEYPAPGSDEALPLVDPGLTNALAPHAPTPAVEDAPSSTPPSDPTDDARATHVQRTAEACAESKLNVNDNVNGNGNGKRETRARSARSGAPKEPKPKKPGKSKDPPFDAAHVPLPDFVSPDVWRDFVADRKERNRPLTPRAVELTLADLAKTPLDADEMLRTSIKRGWTGVFPLDRNKPRASPARDLPTTADFERVPTNAELLGLPGGDQ